MTGVTWKSAIQPGLDSLKAAWAPLLVIQIGGALVVASYYVLPFMPPAMKGIAEAKEAGGFFFAMASGALAGGVIPEAAKALVGRMGKPDRAWIGRTVYTCLCFSFFACAAFIFYGYQTVLFGPSVDPLTVFKKVCFDLFVYVPLVGAPLNALLLGFRSVDLKVARLREFLTDRFFTRRILPIYAPNLVFWGPMLCCVYALPVELQFVFAQVCSAAWSLIVTLIATGRPGASEKSQAKC